MLLCTKLLALPLRYLFEMYLLSLSVSLSLSLSVCLSVCLSLSLSLSLSLYLSIFLYPRLSLSRSTSFFLSPLPLLCRISHYPFPLFMLHLFILICVFPSLYLTLSMYTMPNHQCFVLSYFFINWHLSISHPLLHSLFLPAPPWLTPFSQSLPPYQILLPSSSSSFLPGII